MKNIQNLFKNVNGKLYINNAQCVLISIHTSALLYTFLQQNYPYLNLKLKEIFENLAKQYSQKIISNKKLTKQNKIKLFTEIINQFGFGLTKLKTINLEETRYIFKNKMPIFTKLREKHLKNNTFGAKFVEVLLSAFLTMLHQKKIESKYLMRNGINYIEYTITNENITFTSEKITNENTTNPIRIIKESNTIKPSKIINKNGILYLSRLIYIAQPIETMQIKELNEEKVQNLLKEIGVAYGYSLYQINSSNLRYKTSPQELFNTITNHTKDLGIGKIYTKNHIDNKNTISITFQDSILFDKESKKMPIATYYLSVYNEILSNVFQKTFEHQINKNTVTFYPNGEKHKNFIQSKFLKLLSPKEITKVY